MPREPEKIRKRIKGLDPNSKPRNGALLLSDITPVPIADLHITDVEKSLKEGIQPMALVIAKYVSENWNKFPT